MNDNVWDIAIGGYSYNSGPKLLRELQLHGINFEPEVKKILEDSSYRACTIERKCILESITPKGLHFTDYAFQSTLYTRAAVNSLFLTHSDAPIRLALKHLKQGGDQMLYSAMEPIKLGKRSVIFCLQVSGKEVWIRCVDSAYDSKWPEHARILFEKR